MSINFDTLVKDILFSVGKILIAASGQETVTAAPRIETPSPVRRVPVESSFIVSVGYDAAARVLEIEFERGPVYRYLDVGPWIYEGLIASDSVGRYFNRRVKCVYDFVLVKD